VLLKTQLTLIFAVTIKTITDIQSSKYIVLISICNGGFRILKWKAEGYGWGPELFPLLNRPISIWSVIAERVNATWPTCSNLRVMTAIHVNFLTLTYWQQRQEMRKKAHSWTLFTHPLSMRDIGAYLLISAGRWRHVYAIESRASERAGWRKKNSASAAWRRRVQCSEEASLTN